MKRLTTEEFIERARAIHGDKYDYNLVDYKTSQDKVKIICKQCGATFLQTPNKHMGGRGCPKCNARLGKTANKNDLNRQFIERARAIHGNKYDYSKVGYVNNNTKVEIICPRHGSFWQIPRSHWNGVGCPKCGQNMLSQEEFISIAKEKYGDKFDYTNVDFKNINTNVEIICNNCGKAFVATPKFHLRSGYCPLCGMHHKLTTEEFIERSREIHGDKYDYSKVNYTNIDSDVIIICKRCGSEFRQKAYDHLRGCGCPKCKTSRGEKGIKAFLERYGIAFEEQKRFDNCRNKRPLPFDFYLPERNLCIEFQGVQHYKVVLDFGGQEGFERLQINDEIKRNWCRNEGNPSLLEVKYDDDLERVLSEALGVEVNGKETQ